MAGNNCDCNVTSIVGFYAVSCVIKELWIPFDGSM